jgi:AcrR family transcriptional regulator
MPARARRTRPPESPSRGRLWAPDRRRQLLRVAAAILDREGVDGVRIPDVANAAGVTRPVVYRFFPNRQAILMDLLDEFGSVLEARLEESVGGGLADVEALLRSVVEAVCDTVEEIGAGVWKLLNSAGPDPEIESVAQSVRERLVRPWIARVAEVTGAPAPDARALTAMIAAAVPAVLSQWLAGELRREEAVESVLRGVGGLVGAFSRAKE